MKNSVKEILCVIKEIIVILLSYFDKHVIQARMLVFVIAAALFVTISIIGLITIHELNEYVKAWSIK